MRIRIFIALIPFAIACSQKTKTKSHKVGVTHLTLVDIVDDVPPPPQHLTSNFNSLQDWLSHICSGKKPKKWTATYEFGLFESTDKYVMYLVGLNKYSKEDTSFTRIEFEPSNMYFQLPRDDYKSLNREELLNRLTSHLKDFTSTQEFKTSLFITADSIIFANNGQTIWSK